MIQGAVSDLTIACLQDWHPVVPQIIDRIPWVRRYANFTGRELDQWSFDDRVTLLGDAAHTHGGALAAGAALAIDDAYALSLAFDEIFPPSQHLGHDMLGPQLIRRIFDLYESIRRPHTAKVLAHVHDSQAKARHRLEQKLAGRPESDEYFRRRMVERSDPVWLTEHDVEGAFRKVAAQQRYPQETYNSEGEGQMLARL